jgi:glucitol operon activator protein
MRAVLRQWSDGFVGTGYARGRFLGRGAIVLLVVGPDDRIRRLMIMEGRSIFPRFVPLAEFEGRDFSTLEKGRVFPAREKARNTALAGAVEQIRRAKAKKMLANSSQGAFETAPT